MIRRYSDSDASKYKVIDLDTGEVIPDVRWADDEAGEYLQIKRDKFGALKLGKLSNGEMFVIEEYKKGNIKFVLKEGECTC